VSLVNKIFDSLSQSIIGYKVVYRHPDFSKRCLDCGFLKRPGSTKRKRNPLTGCLCR
jgi:hypothetical protein